MKWFLMFLRVGNDVQQKGWYRSKTVIFNIVTLVAAIIAMLGFYELPNSEIAELSTAIVTIGNIILRFITKTPVGSTTIPNEMQQNVKTINNPSTGNTDKPFDSGTIMG